MGPTDLILRPATAADAPIIRALVRGERLNPFGLRWERFWLAATAEGEIGGCAQVRRHGDGSRELASLVTVPAWRGRGVGGLLVRHLMAEAGPPLWLMCARQLSDYYRRFGFAIVPAKKPLPPHFRRIRLLARVVSLGRPSSLSIMVWPGPPEEPRPGAF